MYRHANKLDSEPLLGANSKRQVHLEFERGPCCDFGSNPYMGSIHQQSHVCTCTMQRHQKILVDLRQLLEQQLLPKGKLATAKRVCCLTPEYQDPA